MEMLAESGGDFRTWADWKPPAAAADAWPEFVGLIAALARNQDELPAQVHRVRLFYQPILENVYDNPNPRARDLEQMEQIASRYKDRRTMLADITLDPPASTQDLAGPPVLDDDYLVLSTIHSAKGLEWDAVYVIHASDGNIPSDMSTGSPEGIEEELRLFYVALTRAKQWLYVCHPLRYYHYNNFSDSHGFAQMTRFLSQSAVQCFQRHVTSPGWEADEPHGGSSSHPPLTSRNVRNRARGSGRNECRLSLRERGALPVLGVKRRNPATRCICHSERSEESGLLYGHRRSFAALRMTTSHLKPDEPVFCRHTIGGTANPKP